MHCALPPLIHLNPQSQMSPLYAYHRGRPGLKPRSEAKICPLNQQRILPKGLCSMQFHELEQRPKPT
jgi:hypothetical protein